MRKRAKYNLKSRITSALRKVWLFSPMRREAVKRGKANGNKCELCGDKVEKLQVDHHVPCANVKGPDGWGPYIDRMMVPSEQLVNLCEPCHKAKTAIQREQRKKYKKPVAKKKK